ncbi:MAG: hypothetical protein KatS3mg008_2131 [Acidimicrobiales bacterium]|nr:MAG: hypothetical protein KatS3mg008_2131 [Acidimicrobiales bacterium]
MSPISEGVVPRAFPSELLWNLTLRNLRARFKRSVLGWLWSVINPATTIVVYAVVFSLFLRVEPPVGDPSGLHSYAFFLTTGLIPWMFTSNTLATVVGSLTSNEGLIRKVWFPRWVLPASETLSALFSYLVELGVLAALLISPLAGVMVIPWLPVVALVVALHFVFVLGLGLLVSPLNAYFRDVQHFTGIFLNIWFWGTPVLYPESLLLRSDGTSKELLGIPVTRLMDLNPMAHFVDSYRALLYHLRAPDPVQWAWMALAAAAALTVGWAVFRRLEPRLAEEL